MMTDDILDRAELAIDDGSARAAIDENQAIDAAAEKAIAEDQYFWAIEMGFSNTDACGIADAAVLDYRDGARTV